MRHTGIFGGSFNPVHYGHLRLARYFVAAGLMDEVWLMVSPQNPLKQRDALLDTSLRLELARAAVACYPGVTVSDFELGLPLPSYTWRTMESLCSAFPDRAFSLIVGADNWQRFGRWARHDELLRRYPLYVYPRPGFPVDAATLPPTVHLVEAPLFPYSSTQVREQIARGGDLSAMLPPQVVDLLVSRGIYTPKGNGGGGTLL